LKDTAAARRYAKAFAATFGDPAALEKAVAELAGFAGVVEQSRELRSVMQNPAVGEAAKTAILDEVLTRMGASATTARLLSLIRSRGRLALARRIAVEAERIAFERLGKTRVEVTSATALSDADRAELTQRMSALSGKEAVVTTRVDPSLIGGVVARIGSVVYDGSVKNQLMALRLGMG